MGAEAESNIADRLSGKFI